MSEHANRDDEPASGNTIAKDYTADKLLSLIKTYPYFAPARFMLLQKLESGSEEYTAQYGKAILYHKDVLEFENLIHSKKFVTHFVPESEPVRPGEEQANGEPTPEENTEDLLIAAGVVTGAEKEQEVTAGLLPETAFEPYHTVDYFASQGIKMTQEALPADNLGKQLKSFTDWLRTMKKLSPADLSKSLDPKTEQKVENLAEHSLHNPEVATEAMAEVWAKQGNRDKAAEVYHKLSLLYPSKRTYFAAKIDLLKNPV